MIQRNGNNETQMYDGGTSITRNYPWGWTVTARVMCPDGKVRKVKRISQTADTWFSIPAAVEVKGKTVAGYVTVSNNLDNGEQTAEFRPYQYRKNFNVFGEA